jgi:hypothetical protein
VSRSLLPVSLALLAGLASGCANYADQLARAEQHYGNARYEAALVNLDDLEIHLGALSMGERVRYDLVRGMTHLRLSQRPDARHWLAMAREDAHDIPSALNEQQRATIERTLVELDPLGSGSSSSPEPGASATPSSGGESSQH